MHVSHHAAGTVTFLAALIVSRSSLYTFSPLTDSILYSNLSTFQSCIMAGSQTVSQHVGWFNPKRHLHKGSQAEQCSTKQQTGVK